MDVKEAVQTARDYVADLFADEGITDIQLEEVLLTDLEDDVQITIGFIRPWGEDTGELVERLGLQRERTYKVVHIGDDGRVKAVTDRVLPALQR